MGLPEQGGQPVHFSKPSLHSPVVVWPEHKAAVERARVALMREEKPKALAQPPVDSFEIPLTTVSLNSNFDAYIDIAFKGAPSGSTVTLLVDSGNSVLIVPRWEDLQALPNGSQNYQVLGQSSEPWGCPANVVRGPISFTTANGSVYSIDNCIFYACIGDPPDGGPRTANFGAGCLSPWTSSGWNSPAGIGITMQAPLSYDSAFPYVEFYFASVEQVHGPAQMLKVDASSSLRIYKNMPSGYRMFKIIPNCEWMSLTPKSLTIGKTKTQWPGTVNSPIAMVDTGGGPVFLSDPNGYVYQAQWPDPVPNPDWTSSSEACQSTSDAIAIELGDDAGSFSYPIDTSSWPASVKGLTLVMCKVNHYMMEQQGMNIGGISALANSILIDFANAQVGFKPK
jgi:hypothetical protein